MLDAAIGPEFGFYYSGITAVAPTADTGTSVTPGNANVEGSWTQIASSANIAEDVYGVGLNINGGASAANITSVLLDLGVDPAGGTSYSPIISNLICGFAASLAVNTGRSFYFPIFIKAGSSVAVRMQASAATANGVISQFYGRPNRPENARAGTFSETIGTITNSSGVAFTPGTSGAKGSWASLGTTAKDMWSWQAGVQIDDDTMQAQTLLVDLAYGDGSNKVPIINDLIHVTSIAETIGHGLPHNFCKRVPGGSTIYVRGASNLAVLDSNYNAVAVGIGG